MKYLFLVALAWGFGNDWVGNGANLSESRFYMAYENLETYMQAGLRAKDSGLNDADRDLLSKMIETISNERHQNPAMLHFLPQSPLFIIDGQIKIAVTGLNLSDPIYINKDRLQRFDAQNRLVDMSLLEAISILVHEFGHHQGVSDHSYLDRLGALVADSARFDDYWMPLFLKDQSIGAQYLAPKAPWDLGSKDSWLTSTTLHFIDTEKHWDVQAEIAAMKLCKRDFPGTKRETLMLWNLFWKMSGNKTAQFNAKLAIQCIDANGEINQRIGDTVTIDVPILRRDRDFIFDYDQRQIKVVYCSMNQESQCERSVQEFERLFSRKNKGQTHNQKINR